MASNDAKLGIGLATGMFFHAPAGTALPSYPSETLAAAWQKVGDITQDGITLATDKSVENLKNWANVIKRVILTDHTETIQAPVMDTTEESLKVVLGESNVTVTAAGAGHGKKVKANLSSSSLPDPEAFLFLMKDGEDMIALGMTKVRLTQSTMCRLLPVQQSLGHPPSPRLITALCLLLRTVWAVAHKEASYGIGSQ